ncbi:glucan biosynthesis protein G [Pseudaestuariivita atlantica]|uniref:Glucan biosynthesis protein G n=2 Tax=Pseudaestuariivita atlantica TaxID=1317121 RepID=A0A0L1JNH3_9RHOB|nr:glucan biosynthesis protein G [Pseudaestuariivita atlantica]
MIRREVLRLLAAVAATPAAAVGSGGGGMGPRVVSEAPFSEALLNMMARKIAARPYQPRPMVPDAWQKMSYDEYKSIWFNTQKAVWSGTDAPLRVDLFHPGLYFPSPVRVAVVEDGIARELGFDWDLFDKTDRAPDLPLDGVGGYSGLRLRTPLTGDGNFQEYAVFQGASYFRVIGKGEVYGLSARGLAIDTAGKMGEEFPDFTRFWVERPDADATMHRVHALMESPSVTGIYHFDLTPGDDAIVDVRVTLWPRRALDNLGIAPLTSMFFFDETNRTGFDDFRPAVHDSDGLTVLNGNGEALWRPLANPRELQVSSFVDTDPQGFGLGQRARGFSDFADLEALYHKRPTLWITPGEAWGKGAVTLVEIPTDKEIYDNIVAYWRPREPLAAGSEHSLSYRMTWTDDAPRVKDVARVLNTRMGRGHVFKEKITAAIDFEPHPALGEDWDDLVIHTSSNRGKVSEGILQTNPETGGPRLAFSFEPGEARSMELRAQLMRDHASVSEVWLYRWTA